MKADTRVNARKKQLKTYAPFALGMRGDDISSGANYQMNLSQSRGILEKTKQSDDFIDITDFDSIEYVCGHTPTTGGDQTLVFGYISGVLKLRVLDEDGNIVEPGVQSITSTTGTIYAVTGSTKFEGTSTLFTSEVTVGDDVGLDPGDGRVYKVASIESDTELTIDRGYVGSSVVGTDLKIFENYGGIGDVEFFGIISARQSGDKTIITHGAAPRMWNGLGITALSGVGATSIALDGSRVAYVDMDGKAKFTDSSPSDGFTGGTGAGASGDYNSGIPVNTAVIEGGTGVVFFGKQKAEAHWVEPNNASDEVSSRTKIESFSYLGPGVKNERFVTSTGTSIVFMNDDGVFEMNPYSGQAANLIVGGKIERYWKEQIDSSNGFVTYNPEDDIILAQVALNSPQNNVFIGFNRREKGMPPFIVSDQYLAHTGLVDGKLVGGANSGGKTFKLFDAFAIVDGTPFKAQYISEFDGLGSPQSPKNLQSISAVVEVSPAANIKMRAYFDNELEPSIEKVFTVKDLTSKDNEAAYGEYVFAVGASDLVQEKVLRGEKVKAGMRFKTIAIEIWEESSEAFKIYDILVEYKSSGRLDKSVSLKRNLF